MIGPDLVGIGTVVVDRVRTVPGFALPGQKRVTAPPLVAPGGVVLNHLAWASALGLKTGLLARLARDEGGRFLREAMRKGGIGTDWIVETEEPTGASEVLAGPGGERAIYSAPGTTLTTTPSQVRQHWKGTLSRASLVSSEISMMPLTTVLEALRLARRRAVDFDIPPDQATGPGGVGNARQLRQAVQAADILKATREAAAAFTGVGDLEGSARALANLMGRRRIAAVTDGALGAAVSDGRRAWTVPAFHVARARDATGAGDAFFGGFLAGLLRGLSPRDAARLGSACGACCVQTLGAFPPERAWEGTLGRYRGPKGRLRKPGRLPQAETAPANLLEQRLRAGGRLHLAGVGKAAFVAARAAATLSSWDIPAYPLDPVSALHGDLGRVAAPDAAILVSKSGETGELLLLARALRKRRIPVIALTAGGRSRLARTADLVIAHPRSEEGGPWNLAPMASLASQASLLDALCTELVDRLGILPERFARNHPGGTLGVQAARLAGKP